MITIPVFNIEVVGQYGERHSISGTQFTRYEDGSVILWRLDDQVGWFNGARSIKKTFSHCIEEMEEIPVK